MTAAPVPGEVCTFPVEPFVTKLKLATMFFDDDSRYAISDDFSMESLHSWIVLSRVKLNSWRDDLLGFLGGAPLVRKLQLSNHGQRELDFSRTRLHSLIPHRVSEILEWRRQ